MITNEKTTTQYGVEPCFNREGAFVRQTFTFGKVFKDSMIGEAGVMLDIQQVGVSGILGQRIPDNVRVSTVQRCGEGPAGIANIKT